MSGADWGSADASDASPNGLDSGGSMPSGGDGDAVGFTGGLEGPAVGPNAAGALEGPGRDLVLVAEDSPMAGHGLRGRVELRVPASIATSLRSYQVDGVRFLFRQWAQGLGGVLADDMGLGKTVQTIAFLAALLGKTGEPAADAALRPVGAIRRWPILVVGQLSVLVNWQREFERWGTFRVCQFHGTRSAKRAALASIVDGNSEVLITSFDTLRLSADLHDIKWHCVFFDEAQRLKNKKIGLYTACATLGTLLRYGLTGTPMQNDHKELYNLLNLIVPGKLGDWRMFKEHYVESLQQAQRSTSNDREVAQGKKRLENFRALIGLYMLRRTKEGTIREQLPVKTDYIVYCQLTDIQKRAYRRLLQSPDMQLFVNGSALCDCGSRKARLRCCYTSVTEEEGGIVWPHQHCCPCAWAFDKVMRPNGCGLHARDGCPNCPICILFACISILRKASNHLKLLQVDLPKQIDDPQRYELAEIDTRYREQVAELAFGEDAEELGGLTLDHNFSRSSDTAACGKVVVLLRLLAVWASEGNNKVLVFSYSRRMLDLVGSMLTRDGYHYQRLDGSTKSADRQRLCDEFNNLPSSFIFLISTLAGGLGLNLTGANKVVVLDPNWNPCADLQAQDRAYRIGQQREVSVYRLIASGTLEELIYMRQLYKQQQSNVAVEGVDESRYFQGVQGHPGQQGELWGIVNLFKDNLERFETHEVIGERRPEEDFRIETVDFSHLEPAGMRRRDDIDEEDGDDAGLNAMARDLGLPDVRGNLSIKAEEVGGGRSQGAAVDAEGPRVGRRGGRHQGALREMEQLHAAGVQTAHAHGSVLGASASEAAIAKRARAAAAEDLDLLMYMPPATLDPDALSTAAVGAVDGARYGIPLLPQPAAPAPHVLNFLESLADWKGGMDVTALARKLIVMDDEALIAERMAYVNDKAGGQAQAQQAAR
ncbi:hypothetical protein WJX81_001965 [Elliptochloris bilobata]|uniref:SNF2 super family n=1 Tax=Elliptochloris bilobata TaxID=381761 RepID=A0AAW1RWF6_9CHLO